MHKDSKAQLHLDYEGGQAATRHSLADRRRCLRTCANSSTPPISYLSLILFNALDGSLLSTRVFIPAVMGRDG